MPSNRRKRNNKISDEVLRKLEDKITSRILENIQTIVSEKCKNILGKYLSSDQSIFSQSRTDFQGKANDSLAKAQNQIKIL